MFIHLNTFNSLHHFTVYNNTSQTLNSRCYIIKYGRYTHSSYCLLSNELYINKKLTAKLEWYDCEGGDDKLLFNALLLAV